MPTCVGEAFAAARLNLEGVLRWGTTPPLAKPGVYVVSLTNRADRIDGAMHDAPLSAPAFKSWLQSCPALRLDKKRPTVGQLMDRVGRFWLGDEVILYIGKAASLSARCRDYYKTPIGAKRPHSGGYFIKLLSNLDRLWVHYAPCGDPAIAEDAMLSRFCREVSDRSRTEMVDPIHPFPFANLEWPKGTRKAHGLSGARL